MANQAELIYGIAAKHGGFKADAESGKRGYNLTFLIAYIRDLAFNHGMISGPLLCVCARLRLCLWCLCLSFWAACLDLLTLSLPLHPPPFLFQLILSLFLPSSTLADRIV